MLLSNDEIISLVKERKLDINPFCEDSVNPAGYDLRCGEEISVGSFQNRLCNTLEWLSLPHNIAGILHLRSSFSREGLIASLALVDPNFNGQLTVSLFNLTKHTIDLSKGEPFLQISFMKLSKAASKGYHGRYQFSKGIVESRRKKDVNS